VTSNRVVTIEGARVQSSGVGPFAIAWVVEQHLAPLSLIEVVDPEGGLLTAPTVTFKSPGKPGK
jgi:hypothetical protein